MSSVEGLELDFTLSPYTGWTRMHWERVLARLTYGYVLAAEKQGSYARALYRDDRRVMSDPVDAIESFARIAATWGAWLHNPGNADTVEFNGRTLDIVEILMRALIEGTDASNPRTYWGDFSDMDQRIVESADIGLAIWFSRERVFNRMTQSERDRVMNWLAQADDKETWYDNWILFPLLPMTVRMQLGYPVDVELLDARLDQMDEFYRGDGWYVDGTYAEYELYNAWMFGWHFLLWAWIDGKRRPEYAARVLKRAQSFLEGFQHFFGANGSYPAWGRSLVYRFSAVSCFATGYLHGIAPAAPGGLRRLMSGSLAYFYKHGFIDPTEHFILQGYHGDMPYAGEAYISPGSPEWACHALAALMFSADDPFWTATEEPLAVERSDFDIALPVPGLGLSGRKETGQVLLLNAGSGHLPENPRHNYTSKYGKLVYSTHFPFNVLPAPHSYAPDAMISLANKEGNVYAHRSQSRAHGVAPGMMWTEFIEHIEDDFQIVRAAVVVWKDVQVRLTRVLASHNVRAFEAPGALGCGGAAQVKRRSNPAEGWEYSEADGRALAIKRLWGYDAQQPSAPFRGFSNINLAYPYAEQPLVYEAKPKLTTRNLASASLLRPAPFDPEAEFAGIALDVEKDGTFHLAFSDGSAAFVSLANVLPTEIEIAGRTVTGEEIRHVRINAEASEVIGRGVTSVAGICELERSGTVRVSRETARLAENIESNVTRLLTNAGIAVNAEWTNGTATQVHVRALGGEWVDVTERCRGNAVPHPLVREWSKRNERALVEFRLTR